MDQASLTKLATLIRSYILTISTQAGSGHPTSSLSAVELMTSLFFSHLRYNLDDPKNPANDRVIFSKGHASPLYYSLFAAAGKISEEDLLKYRKFDSPLEGHPTPRFVYTEAATGSLGQGLSIGVGEALALRMGKSSGHVYVLSGDGELMEGSVWEAVSFASFNKLGNLTLIADINGLGQSTETMYDHHLDVFAKRFEAFGWKVIIVDDGHDLAKVDGALKEAISYTGGPTVLLAKTLKGKGVSFIENVNGWHGKPVPKEDLEKALKELGTVDKSVRGEVKKPNSKKEAESAAKAPIPALSYSNDKPVATRKAFGNALKRLGSSYPEMVVLDGDVQNSTYTEFFGKEFPDRFVQGYIAEQNMIGMAVGLSARGLKPVAASFACFLTRAFDQIRMASHSQANILINGSHAGVSIGEDGPSQMGLEDLAMFRAVHGSTVLYPSDAVSTERLVEQALQTNGIVYMRTTRPETPILYKVDEQFPIRGSKVFESPVREAKSLVSIIAAGITLHEALKAQVELAKENIAVRVIDCYSVKPMDEKTLRQAAKDSKAIIVVEDHYPEGGLGEAVKSALFDSSTPIIHLSVTKTPRSGKPAELLAHEEIDEAAIVAAVKSTLV